MNRDGALDEIYSNEVLTLNGSKQESEDFDEVSTEASEVDVGAEEQNGSKNGSALGSLEKPDV